MTVNDLAEALNRGAQMDVILLDLLSKAFDTVPHNRLVHKLRSYGDISQWIASFLISRFQLIVS